MARLGIARVRVVNVLEHHREIGPALGLYQTLVNNQTDGAVNGGRAISYAWIQECMLQPVRCVTDWNRVPQQKFCFWAVFGPARPATIKRWFHRLKTAGLVEVAKERRAEGEKQPIPEALRWQVFERDDFRCVKCGRRSHLRADHVIPESLGGPTTLGNLQTLCEACNCKKGANIE
jgi:hypothetical protein